MCDQKITQTPLKSRLFKFKSHPHGDFIYWHLPKLHYEKWVQKSPEALRHLGFFGWHPLRMHNMDAGVGFEPHDLRVMSPTSYQAALPCDMFRLQKVLYHNSSALSTLFSLFILFFCFLISSILHYMLLFENLFILLYAILLLFIKMP